MGRMEAAVALLAGLQDATRHCGQYGGGSVVRVTRAYWLGVREAVAGKVWRTRWTNFQAPERRAYVLARQLVNTHGVAAARVLLAKKSELQVQH